MHFIFQNMSLQRNRMKQLSEHHGQYSDSFSLQFAKQIIPLHAFFQSVTHFTLSLLSFWNLGIICHLFYSNFEGKQDKQTSM